MLHIKHKLLALMICQKLYLVNDWLDIYYKDILSWVKPQVQIGKIYQYLDDFHPEITFAYEFGSKNAG